MKPSSFFGELGEQFAVEIERQRLIAVERTGLAAKVEWVARTCGDGVGFDILSFDARGDSEQFIEVKTTIYTTGGVNGGIRMLPEGDDVLWYRRKKQ